MYIKECVLWFGKGFYMLKISCFLTNKFYQALVTKHDFTSYIAFIWEHVAYVMNCISKKLFEIMI